MNRTELQYTYSPVDCVKGLLQFTEFIFFESRATLLHSKNLAGVIQLMSLFIYYKVLGNMSAGVPNSFSYFAS